MKKNELQTNDDYSIVKVYRPTYDLVFDREDNKVKYK